MIEFLGLVGLQYLNRIAHSKLFVCGSLHKEICGPSLSCGFRKMCGSAVQHIRIIFHICVTSIHLKEICTRKKNLIPLKK